MSIYYERLSNLDNSFLALESATAHMHVGAVATFDAEPLVGPSGGVDIDQVKALVASRLHLIPRYRQRLARVPVDGHYVWVDDETFNIDYHVGHTALPKPGSTSQLKRLAGRFMSQPLDRAKPLWELDIVEGLEDGRLALVSKVHHSMIDGIAGVDLMAILLNFSPDDTITEALPYDPRPAPNTTELSIRETSRLISGAVATARDLRRVVDDVAGIANDTVRRVRAVGSSLGSGWLVPTGRTPINDTIGPNRRFDWLDLSLADVKAVKNSLGGSVNDVILATVAGGMRRFLLERRGLPAEEVDSLEYRVMAPVSVRSAAQRGEMGNHVAMWLVPLPVSEADPVKRMRAVRSETKRLKGSDEALGAATIVQLSGGAPTTLVALGARLAGTARPFNATVTNVPGPQFPLYLLSARMRATYPLVPLWRGHGLGIALFSYDGAVHWGFNGDYDLMVDLPAFVSSVSEAFDELLEVAKNPPEPKANKSFPPMGTR